VVHSRNDQEVPQSKITQKPASIFPDNDGAVLLRLSKLSYQPEMLSISCHGILRIFDLTEFSTD